MQFDDVVAISGDDRERWFAVPFSQFIDRVMDIPVARAVQVLAVHYCAEDRGGCVQFLVGFDMPVVVQRLAPGTVSAGSSGVP